jgi:RNA polymerase sigma-70 factor (ECF subfamily)
MAAGNLEDAIRSACEAQRWDDAITRALEGYGPELLSYLAAMTRNVSDADEIFAAACEALWLALPMFRWESSFRTYAYALCRSALSRFRRDPARRTPRVPLSSPTVEALTAALRSETATYLRTESKDRVAELRAQLSPDDQTLLILRVNRGLAWRDIAIVMAAEDDAAGSIERRTAALRKRFERIKEELRGKLGPRGEG